MGFNVAGIEDFGKVMDTFESFNPEIVILDVQLPNMMGFMVQKNERSFQRTNIIFIIS
ncbi:response regulator [Staphylococcus aureus]|nr:response regulator [Staphylococcus aureus]